MDATDAMSFILRPLLAARGFAASGPESAHAAVAPAPTPAEALAIAANERAARVQEDRVRRNMWLAALGGRRFF